MSRSDLILLFRQKATLPPNFEFPDLSSNEGEHKETWQDTFENFNKEFEGLQKNMSDSFNGQQTWKDAIKKVSLKYDKYTEEKQIDFERLERKVRSSYVIDLGKE